MVTEVAKLGILSFYVVFGSGMLFFCGCKFGNPRIKAGDIYSNPFS